MQRLGCGIRVLAMGGKWRRGMDGVEGEAVMEEAGTWWRTLGPVSCDCQFYLFGGRWDLDLRQRRRWRERLP